MSGSKASETKKIEMIKLTIARGLLEVEIKLTMHPLMGKPSTNGLLLHKHNMLY